MANLWQINDCDIDRKSTLQWVKWKAINLKKKVFLLSKDFGLQDMGKKPKNLF